MSKARTVIRRCVGSALFNAAAKPYALLKPGQLPSNLNLRWMQCAWGNPGYSAGSRYLRRVCELAIAGPGPVLECGSGLTTVLLGLMAKRNGFTVTSLEHNPQWHERVTQTLEHLKLDNVTVHLTPLQSYGTFDWYDVQGVALEDAYRVVVCDGPPGKTRGGRVGLMPVMADHLADDAVILMDDTHRKREQHAIDIWSRRRRFTMRPIGQSGRCAELRLTGTV